MSKFRIAILVALLFAIALPFSAQAAGVYYCSTLRASGGTGTNADPWACPDDASFNTLVNNMICPNGGGWLYRIYADSYVYYRIEIVNNQCVTTFTQRYWGYPPNTGVNLPMPLLVGGVASLGAVLILGGVFLRRRTSAA
jgi:hypothetical protein